MLSQHSFSCAFQPIIDAHARSVYSHEALVRGLNNESAQQVISRYATDQMGEFDAASRAKAIEVAASIGLTDHLNLNFMPNSALDAKSGLNSTVEAANRHSFPLDRIIVEATEGDAIADKSKFAKGVNEFRRAGMRFGIDDFGAGHSGLGLLAEFQPDMVKLDISLVRGIEANGPRQAIVRAVAGVCLDLGIDLVAEGVETVDEFSWFTDVGVSLFQGYLFAKPMFEGMPKFVIPDVV